MKKFKFFLPLLAFMAMVFGAFAQNEEPNFYIKETMKSKPGMSEEYYNRQIEEARTMLKQELWVLLDGI